MKSFPKLGEPFQFQSYPLQLGSYYYSSS
ncbi:hypothetical protein V12B01_13565 [Vibrio splendidus 12B01]|nr:hypothetical protein V12B01_13565 [Vibrio splendidus 12B01]